MGSGRILGLAATMALATAAAVVPSSASAVTYGANLGAREANGVATCSQPYLISALPNWTTLPFDSCTVFSSTSVNDPFNSEGTVSPPDGHGFIKRVRVKVGAQTAPMRIIALRALRQAKGGEAACCTGRSRSEMFTPQPNAVTEVEMNLPVVSEFDTSSSLWNFDIVALSVFSGTVPIPAHDSGDPGGTCSSIYDPAIDSNEERNLATNGGACGYTVLLSVDWEADPGPTPPPPPPPPPPPEDGVGVQLPKVANVRNGLAQLLLTCLQDAECAGRLALQNRRAAAARSGRGEGASAAKKKKKKKTRSYGKKSFTIASKQSKKLKVKLNRAGKKLLRKRKRATVWANVTLGSGASQTTQSFKLKLRRK